MKGMRFAAALTLGLAVGVAGLAPEAQALSLGFYGSAGAGFATKDAGWSWADGDPEVEDRDSRHTGGGFALVTDGSPVKYRLGIGWERAVFEGNVHPNLELQGLVIDQGLTLDLVAGPAMRFWVGPELRLGYLHGWYEGAPGGDRNFAVAGIGPVVGFDIELGHDAALSWKLGYLVSGYYLDDDTWGDDYRNDYSGEGFDDDATIAEGHGFLSLTLLFRMADGPQGRW